MLVLKQIHKKLILFILLAIIIHLVSCKKESDNEYADTESLPEICEKCLPAVGRYQFKYIKGAISDEYFAIPFSGPADDYRYGYMELEETGVLFRYLNESHYSEHENKWIYINETTEHTYTLLGDSIIDLGYFEWKCYAYPIKDGGFQVGRIDVGLGLLGSMYSIYIREGSPYDVDL